MSGAHAPRREARQSKPVWNPPIAPIENSRTNCYQHRGNPGTKIHGPELKHDCRWQTGASEHFRFLYFRAFRGHTQGGSSRNWESAQTSEHGIAPQMLREIVLVRRQSAAD